MAYRTRPNRQFTLEEFEKIDEPGYRIEVSSGWLIREPLAGHWHGRIAARIGYRLQHFVEQHGLGEVYAAETGFILKHDPLTVRGPDAAFVSKQRIPAELPRRGYFPAPPDFAVEVVSPTSGAADVQAKVMDYLRAGVRLVWVVYPDSHMVAVHTTLQEARFFDSNAVLDASPVVPGWTLAVAEIFGAPS